MSDLAKQAGVSKNTISLALRHDPQISEKTAERIRRLAQKMGYQKNPTVAHLMTQLRSSQKPSFQASLALFNANINRKAFTEHPTIPPYVQGCRRRATELGYSLDEFWLHDPEFDAPLLQRILRARNIRGAIVVGLMKENRLPARFLPVWEQLPTVVTGVRPQDPALSFSCSDQHALALTAFTNALRLGYKRPALVLDHVIDDLVEGRFSSGIHIAQKALPEAQRTRPFYLVEEARENPLLFRRWFKQEKPDVILTLYNVVRDWLSDLKLAIPRDIGLIQLEWRADRPDIAGMNQHNDIVGEAALEMVINMMHNHAPGLPIFPRATFIGATWVDGSSVRRPDARSGKRLSPVGASENA